MPISLLAKLPRCPKSCKLIVLLLLFPLFFFGQTLTGLWTGALSNDSNTVRKDQSFEIALTEYKGKVYGYSRSEFIVDDTLYYVMKRVKGTIDGDVCEVTDEEIVSYNFRGKLDKGVKVISTFRRNKSDSTWYLDGTWKTNATKKYYSVTGKVSLAEEKDLAASKIFPHLEELNLADQVAFYKERKETPSIARVVKPEAVKTEYSTKPDLATQTGTAITVAKPTLQRAETKPTTTNPVTTDIAEVITENKEEDIVVTKKPATEVSTKEIKQVDAGVVAVTPAAANKTITLNKEPIPVTTGANKEITRQEPVVAAIKNNGAKPIPVVAKENKPTKTEPVATTTIAKANNPVQQKPVTVIKKQDEVPATTAKTTPVVTENKSATTIPAAVSVIAPPQKKEADILATAAIIEGRKSEFSQIVNYKADSLELSLYDNGEIDGDTVSVFMNGEVILAKQGLKASAIKKTIYITPGNEDFTLVLFAENLGKYPPNTGLLVVHDGEDVYNLRFSSDFQKSSGIVFRRKK